MFSSRKCIAFPFASRCFNYVELMYMVYGSGRVSFSPRMGIQLTLQYLVKRPFYLPFDLPSVLQCVFIINRR